MKSSKRENGKRAHRGRRSRRAFAPGTECLEGRQLLTTTWFVNASSPASGADGTSEHPFSTIQAAINAASSGDVVDVAAGTYAESLQVNKSLTLDGPNAGVDPNTGTRSAEAVLVPPGANTGSVVQVLADNVTIDGLTIDGDNPALDPTTGTMLNGVPSFALRGVANFSSDLGTPVQVSGMTVQNDIIRNFTLFGVLGDTPDFAVSSGNVITQNTIDNVPSASTNTALMGRGVSLEDDFYGDVTNNVITRAFQGIQAITSINPGPTSTFASNTVYAYETGININLQDAGTNSYNVTNNQVFAEPGADATSTGIRIAQVLHDDIVAVSGNNVTGFQTGIELSYIAATDGVTVSGGTISNVGVGVLVDNDNPPSGDVPPKATQASLADVTITGASITGIEVRDDESNNVTAAQPFVSPVTLTTDAQTTVTASAEGVQLIMPPTSQFAPAPGQSTAVLVDGGMPTVKLTLTTANPTAGSDSIFTYTTTDNLTTPGDMTVQFSVDGSAALPVSGGTIDLSGLAPGPHTLSAVATDQAGNAATATFQWTITQLQTPTPSLNLTSASDTGSSNGDGITSDNTPTFTGSAIPGSTVALYATGGPLTGTTLLGTATAASNGQWSFTIGGAGSQGPSTLADGSYTVYATATSPNDLVSNPSSNASVVVDTTSPVVTLTSTPASSTAQTSATFAYSATQSPLTTASALTYQYQLDSGVLTALTTNPLSLSNLSPGTHTLTLTATDVAGNTGSTTFTWTITSAQAFTLGLAPGSDTGISDTDGITNDATPTFTGTAAPGSTVSVYATGGSSLYGPVSQLMNWLGLSKPGPALLGTTTAGANGSWTFTVGGPGSTSGHARLADGTYTITAQAQAPGATSTQSAGPISLVIDTRAPTIRLTRSPSPDRAGWYNSPVTYSYTATAANGVSLVSPASGSFTFSSEGANQSHVFTVTDAAGNTATVSTGPVNIDLTPPSRVTASAALISGDSHGNKVSVSVTGTITDALSGAGTSTYSVLDSDGDVVGGGTFVPNANGSYAFVLTIHTNQGESQPRSGPYTIVVGGADRAGNVTLASTTITVPTAPHGDN